MQIILETCKKCGKKVAADVIPDKKEPIASIIYNCPCGNWWGYNSEWY